MDPDGVANAHNTPLDEELELQRQEGRLPPGTAAETGGGDADAENDAESDAEEPAQQFPEYPKPPVFCAEKHQALLNQASNILQDMRTKNGMDTYRTTWKNYDAWHYLAFGTAAPRCPWTALLWTERAVATQYMSYMASNGRSSAQVRLLCT